MSFNSLSAQVHDHDFNERVGACVQQEARNGPNAGTELAANIRAYVGGAADLFIWSVSSATEAQYASALDSGVPNPGADESVVPDVDIVAAVQANWPPDPA